MQPFSTRMLPREEMMSWTARRSFLTKAIPHGVVVDAGSSGVLVPRFPFHI